MCIVGNFTSYILSFFETEAYINLSSADRMLIDYYEKKYIISFTFLHELETYLLRGMKRHSSR